MPTPRAETYIARGKIEQDVRDRLNARGLAAIVGVTAPSGTGKTELALRVSQELEGSTGLKRLWLDVGQKSLEAIVADMALGLGVTFGPNDTINTKLRQIHSQLKDKPRLVVFDDVRQENAPDLPKLLPPRPPNAVLVTSRIKQLEGVPTNGIFELDALTPDQAIELLKAELGPDVVEAERSVAEDLAKRVAYNALALDIAARRINLLGKVPQPMQLFFNSLKSLQELAVESNETDAGRLNLFAVLGLSYDSLTPADQRRLRWLAAFAPSGFSPAAAAQVWGEPEAEAGRALTRLLNLNLLKVVAAPQLRYRLHDLIDEFAANKLQDENEVTPARTAHAQWLIALFEKHHRDDLSNAPEVAGELDNLRYSTQWAAALPKGDALVELATKPRNWLYNIFRINEEWLNWLQKAIQLEIEERGLKATVLQSIGDVQSCYFHSED